MIPLEEVGKAPDLVPLFRTTATVLDIEFDPFKDNIIASAGDDGKISIWEIPQDYSFHHYVDSSDAIKDIKEPLKVLTGHKRKVGHLKFNPVAEDILASSSIDYSVKVWNVKTGEVISTLQHKDLITSFDWNYNGTLIATTSRDRKIRIWDARTGAVLSEGAGHTGAKLSRIVWLGQADRVATTGFSKMSDRQLGVWDTKDISLGPIGGFYSVDLSAGILMPLYDDCTKILYIAGKGDGNIRYFEFESDELYQLSEYQSTDPQRGFAIAPKRAVNVHENEVVKAFKTCGNDSYIEPISFICPRKGDYFQDDIYPDSPSGKLALTAEEWISGKNVDGPILVAMQDLYDGNTPTLKAASALPAEPIKEKTPEVKPEVKAEPKKEPVTETTTKKSPISSNPPSRATSNVDDMMKNSSEVSSMLNKVNDLSEDEAKEDEDNGEWEEESAPAKKVETAPEPKKEVEPVKKTEPEPVKKAEPEPVKSESVPVKSEPEPVKKTEPEPAETTKAEEPEPAKPKAVSGATAGLKANVEKLASTVESLEKIIDKLVQSGIDKDDRIKSLEEKIDQLLKK